MGRGNGMGRGIVLAAQEQTLVLNGPLACSPWTRMSVAMTQGSGVTIHTAAVEGTGCPLNHTAPGGLGLPVGTTVVWDEGRSISQTATWSRGTQSGTQHGTQVWP